MGFVLHYRNYPALLIFCKASVHIDGKGGGGYGIIEKKVKINTVIRQFENQYN
jgi:hypothetical protein